MGYKKLWLAFGAVVFASFTVLAYFGNQIYQKKPPRPEKVVAEDGRVLFMRSDILDGQSVWQSIGGHEVGSIWGHGSYVAPDWTADWLHRESEQMLNAWAQKEQGVAFDELDAEKQAALEARLQAGLRQSTYDPSTGVLTVSNERADAIAAVSAHYDSLFGDDPKLSDLREDYALRTNTIPSVERRAKMNAFFFWASWACATNRPGETVSYTHNWPPDPTVGNVPTSSLVVWSFVSVIFLLAGIAALALYYAREKKEGDKEKEAYPNADPLIGLQTTPSQRATLKYFWVVAAFFVVQVLLGIVTAHYGVEGQGFYGIPLAKILPYSVVRTWHTQAGIFWIATAWLATGLFIAPAISGKEPKFQAIGVNVLFVALLAIVVGSMAGEWMGVMQKLGLDANFWFGHQGYEYVDLGRFWQIFLFAGLLIWFTLLTRAMLPALLEKGKNRHLLSLFMVSSAAIGLFYGAGLMWGKHTNLAMVEYWRWWVVHLWVEGFFEVFATAVIALMFVRMGLLSLQTGTLAAMFSTVIFLTGGIIGTFHHLYFTGTPTAVLALGACFSALEIVPLTLIGFEAYGSYRLSRARPWLEAYKWPIYFLIAVAFWNLVGAGLFGFMINTPIALYYMQGLNTTPLHGHTALFGVYGSLGIGLMLFSLKGMEPRKVWKSAPLSFSFWAINVGLLLMALISLLPVGILQTVASVERGMWHARSAEFMQQPLLVNLKWMRAIGDSIFAAGVMTLAWFVVGLKAGWSVQKEIGDGEFAPRLGGAARESGAMSRRTR